MKEITNKCPICGKCSMSIGNQYCHEHEYLGENTYEHLLDEILNWPEWKLKAAIKFKLFSSKTECSVLRYLIKVRKNTLAETLDNFIAEPVKPYTKEGAYKCLQKLGILDETGEIASAFKDIVVRKDNEIKY